MIPHNRPSIDQNDIDTVTEVLNSNWIAPGRKVQEFEKNLVNYISGNGDSVAVESGTAALQLALFSLGIGKGDEIIIPTYVCTALLNAINYVGAKPVLVDINSYDCNISFEATQKKLSPRTKAIIIPHIYGIPADIDQFLDLNIPIIEDCAQSIGAKYKNQKVGTFGDLAIFSFYATKLLTTGKGGAVYSKNKELVNSIKDLVDYDYRTDYTVRYNYRLNDIQASLGISQLRKLDAFIGLRKRIAQKYSKSMPQSTCTISASEYKENVWYRFVLVSDRDTAETKRMFEQEGIAVINPLENWELLHNYLDLPRSDFPNAERITKKTISVPIYPSLKDEEIKKVKGAIEKVYR